MADQDLNLSILRRVDPDVDEVSHAEIYNQMPCGRLGSNSAPGAPSQSQVLASAAHVCLYNMHVTTQQWVRRTGICNPCRHRPAARTSAAPWLDCNTLAFLACRLCAGAEERRGLSVPPQATQGAALPDDGAQQAVHRCGARGIPAYRMGDGCMHGAMTMTMRPAWRGGMRMEARPRVRIHTVP